MNGWIITSIHYGVLAILLLLSIWALASFLRARAVLKHLRGATLPAVKMTKSALRKPTSYRQLLKAARAAEESGTWTLEQAMIWAVAAPARLVRSALDSRVRQECGKAEGFLRAVGVSAVMLGTLGAVTGLGGVIQQLGQLSGSGAMKNLSQSASVLMSTACGILVSLLSSSYAPVLSRKTTALIDLLERRAWELRERRKIMKCRRRDQAQARLLKAFNALAEQLQQIRSSRHPVTGPQHSNHYGNGQSHTGGHVRRAEDPSHD